MQAAHSVGKRDSTTQSPGQVDESLSKHRSRRSRIEDGMTPVPWTDIRAPACATDTQTPGVRAWKHWCEPASLTVTLQVQRCSFGYQRTSFHRLDRLGAALHRARYRDWALCPKED